MNILYSSILETVKPNVNVSVDNTFYDVQLITKINTALSSLRQLGVGPAEGFLLENGETTWDEFIGDDPRLIDVVDYVNSKVQLSFDPPTNQTALQVLKEHIYELTCYMDAVVKYEDAEIQNGGDDDE